MRFLTWRRPTHNEHVPVGKTLLLFSDQALHSRLKVFASNPVAIVLTAVVVIVALYGCTPTFYWIPSAALSTAIFTAVANLVTPPKQVSTFIRASPIEAVTWFTGVMVSVFSTIENGIYTTICESAALLLVCVAMPRGRSWDTFA
ncbi:hypothetical protein FISHEDRAFT_73984 [Fistulina hepatica ATCC 64428]|uniref:SLC26A/SulP transporter domain-containing protein n=1 Tax=Fistulina hepatica ATCC 64428 TaxID=1128425 RepID=A0A0D7AAN2_9AGAR|nr:hypothetical protein FISHEDRAFT_73984 [Fistulina hepatica ATCC 64428]